MNGDKLGIIGLGNMATAILSGVIKNSSFDKNNIVFYDTDIKKEMVARQLGIISAKSNKDLAENCKYILLAIKPTVIWKVLEEIKEGLTPDTVVISIVAGISTKDIKTYIGKEHKIVRAMPNTPILLGKGVTALCKNSVVTDKEYDFVCSLFNCGGIIETISENKMNEIIAVHGSTPAYITLIAKYFCEYASEQGIPYETANRLFAETLIGTAKLMTDTEYSHEELIDMVTTPNGTTEKGIDALKSWAIQGAIFECCDATIRRAYEIAEEQSIQ